MHAEEEQRHITEKVFDFIIFVMSFYQIPVTYQLLIFLYTVKFKHENNKMYICHIWGIYCFLYKIILYKEYIIWYL